MSSAATMTSDDRQRLRTNSAMSVANATSRKTGKNRPKNGATIHTVGLTISLKADANSNAETNSARAVATTLMERQNARNKTLAARRQKGSAAKFCLLLFVVTNY